MVIIDASVAFKWFNTDERNFNEAKILLKKHLLREDEIFVPDLLLYELSNAWATKSSLTTAKIKKNIDKLREYGLNIIPIEFHSLGKAIEFSKKYKISVYDAIYAVAAAEKKCHLITADGKFIERTNLPYILNLINLPAI